MAEVSNLKINERSNDRTFESLKGEINIKKINSYQRVNMKIGKIASGAESWIDENFEFGKFQKFPI